MSDQGLKKLATSSRRAAFVTICGVIIVILSLVYSAFKLASTEKEARQLQRTNEELQRKLDHLSQMAKPESLREYDIFMADLVKAAKSSEQLRTTRNRLDLAIEQYYRGEFSQSAKTFDEAIAAFGEHPYLLNLKGWSYLRAKQPVEAAQAFEKATSLRPNYGWGFYDLAQAYCENRNYPKAELAFKEAVRLDANLAELIKNDVQLAKVCAPMPTR